MLVYLECCNSCERYTRVYITHVCSGHTRCSRHDKWPRSEKQRVANAAVYSTLWTLGWRRHVESTVYMFVGWYPKKLRLLRLCAVTRTDNIACWLTTYLFCAPPNASYLPNVFMNGDTRPFLSKGAYKTALKNTVCKLSLFPRELVTHPTHMHPLSTDKNASYCLALSSVLALVLTILGVDLSFKSSKHRIYDSLNIRRKLKTWCNTWSWYRSVQSAFFFCSERDVRQVRVMLVRPNGR